MTQSVAALSRWSLPLLLSVALVACKPAQPPAAPGVAEGPAPEPPRSERPVEPAPAPGGTYVAPLVTPVPSGPSTASDVAGLVERLQPAVVNIITQHTNSDGPGGIMNPFHRRRPDVPQRSLGSGFIVDPGGLVVTNAHVIDGATDIKVRLSDERELPAKVVGKDSKLDLALLRLEGGSNLSAVTLGDSDGVRVGEWVIAIGNPFGLGHTVTLGIVSAKDRTIGAGPYDAFIQTDASINPGNSGGPLFNLKGEVIGIPTAIRQGAQGIGFAVPANALRDVLPQLRDKGAVSRGKLGVRIQHVSDELAKAFSLPKARGALVSQVEAGGSAAKAGIVQGDVIVTVNGAEVKHSEDLPRMVARNAPGAKIKVGFFRNGKAQEAQATLDLLAVDDDDEDEPKKPSPKPAAPSEPPSRLGVQIDDAPAAGGARVRVVAPGSPASGQLMPGDVIVEINRQPVKSAADAMKKTENVAAGTLLVLRVRRGSDERFVALRVK